MLEFTINKKSFSTELGLMMGVAEKKSTIPVLSNLLLESSNDDSLRITGTDLDVTLTVIVDANIKSGGKVLVPARKLFDIVRLAAADEITFKEDENNWSKVKAGNSNYRIAGMSADSFPEVPDEKRNLVTFKNSVMRTSIQRTSFAITQEQSRFTLSGAKLLLVKGDFKMISTDGHRLALNQHINGTQGALDCIVPKKALAEILKMTTDVEGEIKLGESPNHIYAETGNRILIARKLSGTFPNWEMVMPGQTKFCATIGLDEIRAAIRRVVLMSDQRTKSILMTVKPNEVVLTSQSSEEGEAVEVVKADYAGEETVLSYNSDYLQDMLNSLSNTTEADEETNTGVQLELKFNDGNSQSLMQIKGESGYNYVLMPLRV